MVANKFKTLKQTGGKEKVAGRTERLWIEERQRLIKESECPWA